ncbi:hypothetical protein JAAARDRAFT_40474 [Jaapia argillacea MUCL 33604]|uniref:Uncharacterized protein n=1 Tax=Jaapia argillacea MUCL 33604 TaxID=933084 RepID=A0A067PE47_9AGAM|nr:hypothetical protein JAAARDRAFT_40474 [Jaapia argillacea MUCL 33604]
MTFPPTGTLLSPQSLTLADTEAMVSVHRRRDAPVALTWDLWEHLGGGIQHNDVEQT